MLTSATCQEYQDCCPGVIDFSLSDQVDSVTLVLLNQIEREGWIDSVIVEWSINRNIRKYRFYKIPNKPIENDQGEIINHALWLKKRTNRILKVGNVYKIPLIHQNDCWTDLGKSVERPIVAYSLGKGLSPYIKYSSLYELKKNWLISQDKNGKYSLVIYRDYEFTVELDPF